MAVKANLDMDQGAYFKVVLDIDDSTDISGFTGAAQMRKSYYSTSYHEFDVSIANNEITLTMSSNTTESIEPGRYMYDLEITSPGNIITRVIEGIVTVSPNMTR